LGDFEKAIKEAQGEEDPDIIFNRGKCYMKLKEYTKAHEDFDKVIEMSPDNPEYLCTKA